MIAFSPFFLQLTAQEGRLSTDPVAAAAPRLPRRGHSARRCAFVYANYKTGAFSVVKTGASAVVLDWR